MPDYKSHIRKLLDATDAPFTLESLHDAISSKLRVSEATFKKHLRIFISENPQYLDKLLGFYPDVDTIINMAEEEYGATVSGSNLFEINKACKSIVDRLTKPLHEHFLRSLLDDRIDASQRVSISFDELLELVYQNYPDFITERGNSLVSIAGSLNERILVRVLINSGLAENADFRKTGTQSEGDLNIFYQPQGGSRKTLYVEIKSYHARERFLRGLRDIPHPDKIGIGFFISPKEFNPSRTDLYVSTGTWAIYMPDITYEALEDASRRFTSVTQSKLYRPMSMFCDDMEEFCRSGRLRRH